MRLTTLSLLLISACAIDAGDDETLSTDIAKIVVIGDCAAPTSDTLNATSSIGPDQYDSYFRNAASTSNPSCRAESRVAFTVSGASTSHPVTLHGSSDFLDVNAQPPTSPSQCANSTLDFRIWKQTSPGHWQSVWHWTGHGNWDSTILVRRCHAEPGFNGQLQVPDLTADGVYRVDITSTRSGIPAMNADINVWSFRKPGPP